MSFATFADLKANVKDAFNDREPPAFVYELVTSEINNRLRVLQMETEVDLAVSGEATALPADFLEVRHVYLDTTPRVELDMVSEFSKNANYRSSGEPRSYTIINGFILLNPVPDGSYTVTMRYIAKLADLSADADTNTILTTFPQLYMYGALWQAAMWEGDGEAAVKYEQTFVSYLDRVNQREQRARYGGGPLKSYTASAP